MNKLYLVTGAAGHLGNTVVRMLAQKGGSGSFARFTGRAAL